MTAMRARRKGDDLPVYSRAVVELAEEQLPDPDECEDMTRVIDVDGVKIGFVRVPTVLKSSEGATYWRYELIGRVEEDKH